MVALLPLVNKPSCLTYLKRRTSFAFFMSVPQVASPTPPVEGLSAHGPRQSTTLPFPSPGFSLREGDPASLRLALKGVGSKNYFDRCFIDAVYSLPPSIEKACWSVLVLYTPHVKRKTCQMGERRRIVLCHCVGQPIFPGWQVLRL
jgi:hypothetical protein